MISKINLSPKIIDQEMSAIFTPVKLGESGLVVCYPACQQDFNVARFLLDKKRLKKYLGSYHNRFAFISIHLNPRDNLNSFVENFRTISKEFAKNILPDDNLKQICQKILNNGRDPYLFIFNAHSVKNELFNTIALTVHELILSLNRFGAQIFYEGDIYKQTFITTLSSNNKFLRNVFMVPSYSLEETKYYLKSLSKEWQMKLIDEKINEITNYCFGYLWVLREVIRLIKVNKNDNLLEILEMPSIRLRIETIVKMLDEAEKKILIDLLSKKPSQKIENENDYLFRIGIIIKQNGKYTLPLKPMIKLLSKAKIVNKFYIDKNQNIIYEDKNINLKFSNSELKVIRLLIIKKGQLTTREEIAKAIWEEEYLDKYSEWAIDKLLSRIRSILIKIGLPKDIIKTKKGQGFILS